eukprot:CAMPEP_0176368620 /NCGR_PEP_ID=MMETSP0126-20121128/22727_1 /TAXON_ID=141414 ORGANISM="Strombidinopsis acuminatum, Strain SPMC142" /NCGR_SAMPLE_ID=MMETSP0126 /ASSEMBLY_ACC=CAM_ASM_000229 /LENGTH=103 /DNA_ID=CAMNT_0017726953 /DNA_START=81 /DNA_END=392 /DNA_ORIENTATION=-
MTYNNLETYDPDTYCGDLEGDISLAYLWIIAHSIVLGCDLLRNFSAKCFKGVEMKEFMRSLRAVAYFAAIIWSTFNVMTMERFMNTGGDAEEETGHRLLQEDG